MSIGISWSIFKIGITHESFLYRLNEMAPMLGFSDKAKIFIDSLSFYDTIWIQGSLQLMILVFSWRALVTGNCGLLKKLLIADLVLATLLHVPFTGAGKTSVAHLQSVLDRSPAGLPIPELHPIRENDTISVADNALLGEWFMYNKQPGSPREMPYPIQLKNMRAYFDGLRDGSVNGHLDKPLLFSLPGSANIHIISFSPNYIRVSAPSKEISTLVLQQNKYPHWFYKTEGKVNPVQSAGINFMAAPLKQGSNEIEVFFNPRIVKLSLYASGIVFLIYVVLIISLNRKKL